MAIRLAKQNFCRQIKQNPKNLVVLGKITNRAKHIFIGENVSIYTNVIFWGDGDIHIGNNVMISDNVIIYASKDGGVSIGDNTSIAAFSYIIDSDHGTTLPGLIRSQPSVSKRIQIGSDVWIGAGAMILKGSIIEDGAVVGAKALVKGNVPKNAIVVGTPAKIIKYRLEIKK